MLMGMGRLTIRYLHMMYFSDLLMISLDQVDQVSAKNRSNLEEKLIYLSLGVHCRHEKKSEGARKCKNAERGF